MRSILKIHLKCFRKYTLRYRDIIRSRHSSKNFDAKRRRVITRWRAKVSRRLINFNFSPRGGAFLEKLDSAPAFFPFNWARRAASNFMQARCNSIAATNVIRHEYARSRGFTRNLHLFEKQEEKEQRRTFCARFRRPQRASYRNAQGKLPRRNFRYWNYQVNLGADEFEGFRGYAQVVLISRA